MGLQNTEGSRKYENHKKKPVLNDFIAEMLLRKEKTVVFNFRLNEFPPQCDE